MAPEMRQISSRASALTIALSLFLTTSGALAIAAPGQQQISPAGPWKLDQAGQSCNLSRMFGDEKSFITINFERFSPGDLFQLIIASNFLSADSPPHKVQIQYGEGGYTHDADYLPGTTPDGQSTMWISSSTLGYRGKSRDGRPVITPAQEAAIHEITLVVAQQSKLVLNTGSLGGPFSALNKCTDDLVRSWGLDPEQQRNMIMLAKPNGSPSGWVKPTDYPRGTVLPGTIAIANFRLIVDSQGKPSSCQITHSYSTRLFDRLSCDALMRRASFSPALDEKGQPISSYYVNTVRMDM